MTRILVIDDEPALVALTAYNLRQHGYDVLTANDGSQLLQTLQTTAIDLVLLDVMLPGQDGVALTKAVRQAELSVPIIMITALTSELDTVIGLEVGADDYITKPFSPREMVARVKAVLRRFEDQHPVEPLGEVIGPLRLDLTHGQVWRDNQLLKLTPKEYELLVYLVQNTGKVLSRDELLEGVWGYTQSGTHTRMVDMHLSHLRDKIEVDPKQPELIKTIRSRGYRFDHPNLD